MEQTSRTPFRSTLGRPPPFDRLGVPRGREFGGLLVGGLTGAVRDPILHQNRIEACVAMSLRVITDLEDQLAGLEIAADGAIYKHLEAQFATRRDLGSTTLLIGDHVVERGRDDLGERGRPALRTPLRVARFAGENVC